MKEVFETFLGLLSSFFFILFYRFTIELNTAGSLISILLAAATFTWLSIIVFSKK